ncbi:unnamed protein product [Arctia plantaginis]|uniref:Uncharacterized protein n=1 Tax=Arctia plantaginis TaxID=874455 RepID=A0A8S0Z1Z1_ARCPL|nr:unnamed protein product [Arctia plantaginis]
MLACVQEFGSTIPTPPGLGCWQPPPGFKYQCVQLPFPASGFWHPSLNMPPIGNEGMHSMHSVQLPPGAPVNQDRSQASTIDITTVSAQQLSLNQRKENHNEEKIKLLLRQISQFEDDNLDQAVASIFQEPKRKVISKRRMPRRPRPPVARQVCCCKDTMSVKKCNSKSRIKAPASQSSKKATLQPAVVVENSTEIKSPYKSPPPMIASVAQSRRSVQHLPRPIPRYACHISHYRA